MFVIGQVIGKYLNVDKRYIVSFSDLSSSCGFYFFSVGIKLVVQLGNMINFIVLEVFVGNCVFNYFVMFIFVFNCMCSGNEFW